MHCQVTDDDVIAAGEVENFSIRCLIAVIGHDGDINTHAVVLDAMQFIMGDVVIPIIEGPSAELNVDTHTLNRIHHGAERGAGADFRAHLINSRIDATAYCHQEVVYDPNRSNLTGRGNPQTTGERSTHSRSSYVS